jgi:hypothetical protein
MMLATEGSTRTARWPAWALSVVVLLAANCVPVRVNAWGDRTHPALTRLAIETLPAEAAAYFGPHADELARRSIEPDTVLRSRDGRAEEVRHFIDLDVHMLPPFRGFPRQYADAVRRFGKREVDENGVLPWVIMRFHRQLTEAIRAGDTGRAIREASYLGHYVADSFQPLHLTKNYDGQFSGAQGIHKRLEDGVVDADVEHYMAAARRVMRQARLMPDVRTALFAAIFRSYDGVDTILRAEADARQRGPVDSPAYFARLHELLDPLVRERLAEAATMMGSLWLTAWADAAER